MKGHSLMGELLSAQVDKTALEGPHSGVIQGQDAVWVGLVSRPPQWIPDPLA